MQQSARFKYSEKTLFSSNIDVFPRSSGFLLHLKVFIEALSMISSGDHFKGGDSAILTFGDSGMMLRKPEIQTNVLQGL
jgi:hypothetical protein